jgi:exonuclease VII large subunit
MPPNNSPTDMTFFIEWMKRLEDKFDSVFNKLEEKTEYNYKRLEDKLDSSYDVLEKKINEYIEVSGKNLDGAKEKLQDHEYRLRSIEAYNKIQNEKIIENLTKNAEKKEDGLIKKLTKLEPTAVYIILILAFVSGNFKMITDFFKIILKIP